MRRPTLTATMAVAALAVSGCGANKTHTSASQTQPAPHQSVTTGGQTTPVALERAAHSALEQNHTLSDYVLSHNAIPSWASQSTSGPALAAMSSSAAHRRGGKVQVRVLTSALEIRSVTLDPSYTRSTASFVERSRVRVYQDGRAVGGVRTLNEPARVELRRVDNKTAFVVWRLTAL
jgi:hypothetical protein